VKTEEFCAILQRMKDELTGIKQNALSMILEANSRKELEEIKLQFVGRSGSLTVALKGLAKLSKEERPEMGVFANEIKKIIEDAIDEAEKKFEKVKLEKVAEIDVTDPGVRPPLGHLHLVTQAIEEITEIFSKIGFSKSRYPEVEWDWYAFGALNFPKNHPARDDWETFFINEVPDPKLGAIVLTPHTSSGQIREMLHAVKQNPKQENLSIKMLNIAKCYRRQSDVSHTSMFHQFEGLVVGKNIAITHLKGTLDYFVKSYFGNDRVSRIRPYHFQFTEPSFEVDVSCGVCKGKGCRLCKEGWLEMGGSGMVHPNVLRNCGIDPEKYTGFAFGWGVERVLMMKDGIKIDDIRMLYANNLDFLEQF
jgi:phenylalanyl-tRNA synthetase alpha chain